MRLLPYSCTVSQSITFRSSYLPTVRFHSPLFPSGVADTPIWPYTLSKTTITVAAERKSPMLGRKKPKPQASERNGRPSHHPTHLLWLPPPHPPRQSRQTPQGRLNHYLVCILPTELRLPLWLIGGICRNPEELLDGMVVDAVLI